MPPKVKEPPVKDQKAKKPAGGKSEPVGPSIAQSVEAVETGAMFKQGFLGALQLPPPYPQLSQELVDKHLAATDGKVITRFPPEPNGYLHIGHSKAITVNFGYARANGGICYLRFDDTNPEKEEEKYFTAIEDMVKWLGFEPYKITYSSDYFLELYMFAEDLIKRGKAYTCTCSDEEIKANRGSAELKTSPKACQHQSKDSELCLTEFREMRAGAYKPKEIVLRMKQDLSDGNPQMWDLIAYRVLTTPHHRTGDTWKIYPTYDFTHCLVDSLENITHSLCTTEFTQSRVSYEWLCHALEVYTPAQREYGRLNLEGTIMSKRKIEKLVKDGYVRDWNDPRLYTLVALRRRGVPPGAILGFVSELGVTQNKTSIQIARFDNSVRSYLEMGVPRLMMIPDPIKIVLTNVADDFLEMCEVPFNPKDASMGSHQVPLTKVLYIDRSDFREVDSKDYFRLAPGKSVGLLKATHTIRAESFESASDGRIEVVYAQYEHDVPFKKPKTYIQWVAESKEHKSPVKLQEVRQFSQLFKSSDPDSCPGGFLSDINPDTEEIIKGAIIETGFWDLKNNGPWPKTKKEGGNDEKGAPESIRFQALRVGYFCVDQDSTDEALILNRIVTLKKDIGK